MGIRDRFSSAGAEDETPSSAAGAAEQATTPEPTPEPTEAPEPAEPTGTTKRSRTPKPSRTSKPRTTDEASRGRADLTVWRTRASQLLWTAFVLLALVLAVAALLVAIDANEDNGLVDVLLRAADAVDLGVFSRENGVREFTGDNAETKNALFNWGLGAVVYLLVGRVVERLVRPGR